MATIEEREFSGLQYKCKECGTPLGFDGLCWKCRRRDLTPEGEKYFFPFSHKFILYTDRTSKTPSEKLIKKWLDEVRNE